MIHKNRKAMGVFISIFIINWRAEKIIFKSIEKDIDFKIIFLIIYRSSSNGCPNLIIFDLMKNYASLWREISLDMPSKWSIIFHDIKNDQIGTSISSRAAMYDSKYNFEIDFFLDRFEIIFSFIIQFMMTVLNTPIAFLFI